MRPSVHQVEAERPSATEMLEKIAHRLAPNDREEGAMAEHVAAIEARNKQVVRDHGRAKDRDGRWKALLVRGADRYRNFGENPPPELSTAGPVF
jgi:hypothetical protein